MLTDFSSHVFLDQNGFATGLIGLARGLALDLSKNLIRVNAVSPGVTETEL